jgi:CO/xanthine dehydrogenase FAD-binding subunit
MRPFEYFTPITIAETSSLLQKLGHETKIVAGGTDLVPSLKLRLFNTKHLVDISRVKELEFTEQDRGGVLRIGALTRHAAIEKSPAIRENAYVLAEAASSIGSPQVRNMGTIGGNIANASPCSDTAVPLLVLGANLRLVTSCDERLVPLDGFFRGVKETMLQSDQLLTEIQIPTQAPETGGAFMKIGRRTGPDLALVSAATAIVLEKDICRRVRIALGSVAPTPIRAKKAESFLTGKKLEGSVISEASEIASGESSPISDVRASADYRRKITPVAVEMTIRKAIARTRGRLIDQT